MFLSWQFWLLLWIFNSVATSFGREVETLDPSCIRGKIKSIEVEGVSFLNSQLDHISNPRNLSSKRKQTMRRIFVEAPSCWKTVLCGNLRDSDQNVRVQNLIIIVCPWFIIKVMWTYHTTCTHSRQFCYFRCAVYAVDFILDIMCPSTCLLSGGKSWDIKVT